VAAAPSIAETTAKPLNVDIPPDFEDAYTTMVLANEASVVKSSCGSILKKLLLNATTKGQTPGEDAAEFPKVRSANPPALKMPTPQWCRPTRLVW
jgi:hypothetical protein